MLDIKTIKVNSKAIEEGAWRGKEYGTPIAGMGDLCLKVRGLGNTDYRVMRGRLVSALPAHLKGDDAASVRASDDITTECLVETILLDWKGIGENGQPIEFSKHVARQLLSDPDMDALRGAIMVTSTEVAGMRADDIEAVAGN